MENTAVAAIIVTYNRAPKLATALASVISQSYAPSKIYVIDNASTDNTANVVAAIDDPRIEYTKLPKNIGGAGGFNHGLKLAYKAGHDFFWLFDDDAYPEPNALKTLVENTTEFIRRFGVQPSFACSSIRWTDGDLCEMNTPQVTGDWPRYYSPDLPVILVKACSFVSVLVPRSMVKRHGLPIAEYFIWYDDIEYTLRLSKAFPGLFCLDSRVIHDVKENRGVDFSLVTSDNVWKYCYGVRNEASACAERGLGSYFIYLIDTITEVRRGTSGYLMRLKIYKALWDGLFFRPRRESMD